MVKAATPFTGFWPRGADDPVTYILALGLVTVGISCRKSPLPHRPGGPEEQCCIQRDSFLPPSSLTCSALGTAYVLGGGPFLCESRSVISAACCGGRRTQY